MIARDLLLEMFLGKVDPIHKDFHMHFQQVPSWKSFGQNTHRFCGCVWVHLMWSSNSSFHVGLESRISQAEGFFPIRVLLCPFWLPYCLNVLGQISQSDCLCNVLWSSKFTSCIEADIRALSNKICNLIFITSTCMHWTHGGNNSIIKILFLLCEKFRDGKMLPTVG